MIHQQSNMASSELQQTAFDTFPAKTESGNGSNNSTIIMDGGKLSKKLADKTKLSFANGVFDASLLINLLKDIAILTQMPIVDGSWYISMFLVCLSFMMQIVVFGILSCLAVVSDKKILEKMNNSVLVISSFILLFEVLRGIFSVNKTKS